MITGARIYETSDEAPEGKGQPLNDVSLLPAICPKIGAHALRFLLVGSFIEESLVFGSALFPVGAVQDRGLLPQMAEVVELLDILPDSARGHELHLTINRGRF